MVTVHRFGREAWVNPRMCFCTSAAATTTTRTRPCSSAPFLTAAADIPADVSRTTGLAVVWGPSESDDRLRRLVQPRVRRRKCRRSGVFRRRSRHQFRQPQHWLKQDFASPRPRPRHAAGCAAGSAGRGAVSRERSPAWPISFACATHRQATSLVEFLSGAAAAFLYVTGHSLGGTLAPPLFAYLNARAAQAAGRAEHGAVVVRRVHARRRGFNGYFNSILPDSEGFLWRIQNSLDIAPLCWCAATACNTCMSRTACTGISSSAICSRASSATRLSRESTTRIHKWGCGCRARSTPGFQSGTCGSIRRCTSTIRRRI